MKKRKYPKYDPVTRKISSLAYRIPRLGPSVSKFYLWRFTMINFMIVGASGLILSFLLYEGLFRILLVPFWGGTFIGMFITTILVFFWNYLWNRHWSLSIDSQLLAMKKGELKVLQGKIQALLNSSFDHEGRRK